METMSPLADKKARMRFNKAMREKGLGAKACSRCFVVKGLTQYNASRAKSDGRVTTCKPCMVVTARKWDETNRERRVEIGRQWR
jgi:hypothetical protein